MPLENRELAVGTRLVGRYKKEAHLCEVVQGEDGSTKYRLADGREYKSPSAAGSAVMGGMACNGWRFWSLAEGEQPEAKVETSTEAKPKQRKRKAKGNGKLIKRWENQEGVAEGIVRYWCNACLDTFEVEGDAEPEACPKGHSAEAEAEKVEE